MIAGQVLQITSTGTRFRVEETAGQRGIARSPRTGGRIMVFEEPGGFYGRRVTDNGAFGDSLFASLEPVGRRFAMTDVPGEA